MAPSPTPALARAALALFVACLVAAHLLNAGLDPAQHMVSEYANHRAGWVIEAGFGAWAAALLLGAAGASTRAVLGVIVLAIFPTQTSAGELPPGVARSTGGRLHDLGADLATVALVAAAVTSAAAARRRHDPQSTAIIIVLGTVAVATIAGLAIGPSVAGLRQRAMLGGAAAWLWLLSRPAATPRDSS
jgi:Protein of unknown function (DUF998)